MRARDVCTRTWLRVERCLTVGLGAVLAWACHSGSAHPVLTLSLPPSAAPSARRAPEPEHPIGVVPQWTRQPGRPDGDVWIEGDTVGVVSWAEVTHRLVVRQPDHEALSCAIRNPHFVVGVSKGGSLTVWDMEGHILAHHPHVASATPQCHVSFSPDERFMATDIESGRVRVFSQQGELMTVPFTGPVAHPKFTADSKRLFVLVPGSTRTAASKLTVVDLEKPNVLGDVAINFVGRTVDYDPHASLIAAVVDTNTVAIHDATTLAVVRRLRVPVAQVWFLREGRLMVQSDEPPQAAVFDTKTWKKLWSRHGARDFQQVSSTPWLVGVVEHEYRVVDARSGVTVGSWSGSGHEASGYFDWAWTDDGYLWFFEAGVVRQWQPGAAVTLDVTEHSGADAPLFDKRQRRVVAFNKIWDVAARKPLAKLELELPYRQPAVQRWSRDEKLLLGSAMGDGKHLLLAWDAQSGAIVWSVTHSQPIRWLTRDGVPWARAMGLSGLSALVDEYTGKLTWVAPVVSAPGKAELLAFNDRCWDGPRPPELDEQLRHLRRCDGLLASLREQVATQ